MTEEVRNVYIDHTRGRHNVTSQYQVLGLVETDNKFNCIKPGWLNLCSFEEDKDRTHDNNFGIVFSPGKGIVIHKDLYDKLAEPEKSPLKPSKQGTSFHMGTSEQPLQRLDIIGETIFPFAVKEWHNWGYHIHFKVRPLVTTSELPRIEPNFSGQQRSLAWIGIEFADPPMGGSLVHAASRIGSKGRKPVYRVIVEGGELAGSTEDI